MRFTRQMNIRAGSGIVMMLVAGFLVAGHAEPVFIWKWDDMNHYNWEGFKWATDALLARGGKASIAMFTFSVQEGRGNQK